MYLLNYLFICLVVHLSTPGRPTPRHPHRPVTLHHLQTGSPRRHVRDAAARHAHRSAEVQRADGAPVQLAPRGEDSCFCSFVWGHFFRVLCVFINLFHSLEVDCFVCGCFCHFFFRAFLSTCSARRRFVNLCFCSVRRWFLDPFFVLKLVHVEAFVRLT